MKLEFEAKLELEAICSKVDKEARGWESSLQIEHSSHHSPETAPVHGNYARTGYLSLSNLVKPLLPGKKYKILIQLVED